MWSFVCGAIFGAGAAAAGSMIIVAVLLFYDVENPPDPIKISSIDY